jgi:hypothetical protein
MTMFITATNDIGRTVNENPAPVTAGEAWTLLFVFAAASWCGAYAHFIWSDKDE